MITSKENEYKSKRSSFAITWKEGELQSDQYNANDLYDIIQQRVQQRVLVSQSERSM
jgi:hypothetical protein